MRPLARRSRAAVGIRWLGMLPLACFSGIALADDGGQASGTHTSLQENVPGQEGIVSYPAEFFTQYRPGNALEMVQRIPGFQIDDGDDERGLGGAVGNVLLNDRYPNAKQDKATDILERIPAGQVQRIELIRTSVRDIDLRGQPVVANVILRENIPAITRYSLSIRKNFESSPLSVGASASVSNHLGGIEYNAGIFGRRFASGEWGTTGTFDAADAPLQHRLEDSFLRGDEGNANLNVQTWLGSTLLQANSKFAFENRHEVFSSVIGADATGSGGGGDFFVEAGEIRGFELGASLERPLIPDLLSKMILLYIDERVEMQSSQNRLVAYGAQELFRLADSMEKQTEAIARVELNWTTWAGHTVQLDVEGARNAIDSTLVQTVDTGSGPIIVPLPGANTRVQEDRGNVILSDVWTLQDFEIDYGLGVEVSRISQTGDATQTRRFTFLKPHATLTHSGSRQSQWRLRLAREVSQLEFEDFVSTTLFRDDDLLLGNPDLKPQSSWVAELSHERRFGKLSVINVTVFYHWISDVQDLLPLAPTFEAPGNIGDGERYGVVLETTVPLDTVGLSGARVDIEARLQESNVTDPVTGIERELTADPALGRPLAFNDDQRHSFAVNFRQDLEGPRFAWGWNIRRRSERSEFKVNELDVHSDGTELNLFVETTRWLDQKITLTADNVLDLSQRRTRVFYEGERDLSPLDHRERRTLYDGRRVMLTITGSF